MQAPLGGRSPSRQSLCPQGVRVLASWGQGAKAHDPPLPGNDSEGSLRMPGLETGWEVRAGPGLGGPQAVKWDSRRPPRGAELEPERTPACDGRLLRRRHGGPTVPSRGRSLGTVECTLWAGGPHSNPDSPITSWLRDLQPLHPSFLYLHTGGNLSPSSEDSGGAKWDPCPG